MCINGHHNRLGDSEASAGMAWMSPKRRGRAQRRVSGKTQLVRGAAEFWAMSGAATKLPPKKLLQRHAGPSQRAAGQLLWRCAPCGLRKRAKTQDDLVKTQERL